MNLGQAIGILSTGARRHRMPPTGGAKLVVNMLRNRYPDWVRSGEVVDALDMTQSNCLNRLLNMYRAGFVARRGGRGSYEYRWKAPSVIP